MVARVRTVAFHGVEVIEVETQVTIASGLPAFTVVGLPDKAVAESRERVRAALGALGLALPPRRITVNLAPADVVKEGSHFDLPIALALLAAMDVLPADELGQYTVLGELSLDGSLTNVAGVLLAALAAASRGSGVICPAGCGGEAAWAGEIEVIAAPQPVGNRQSFQGYPALAPTGTEACRRGLGDRRPSGRQGPGERQAGARDRRGRWAQPADGRPSRIGEVDAGRTAAWHIAAARTG
jgi:magnesium chelatase family protein